MFWRWWRSLLQLMLKVFSLLSFVITLLMYILRIIYIISCRRWKHLSRRQYRVDNKGTTVRSWGYRQSNMRLSLLLLKLLLILCIQILIMNFRFIDCFPFRGLNTTFSYTLLWIGSYLLLLWLNGWWLLLLIVASAIIVGTSLPFLLLLLVLLLILRLEVGASDYFLVMQIVWLHCFLCQLL